MTPQLKKKIDFAIFLLRNIPQDGTVELAYSGGKDSDVILRLAQMAGIKFEPIHKVTTIDTPGTIQHAKDNGCTIVRPKKTFFQIVRSDGLPTMWQRFCCGYLKEYKIHDRAIVGIRREESVKRSKRYNEPEQCRTYRDGKKVRQYFPILEWTNDDVATFIDSEHIQCHKKYYDDDGTFHVERRLGCIGCPLANPKDRISQYKHYPGMLRQTIKNFQYWLDSKPESKQYQLSHGSATNKMMFELFYQSKSEEFENAITGGLFPEMAIDSKQFLENYFGIKL